MVGRPRKATSVTTEMVLGSAAQNLKKAVAELTIAVDSVKTLEVKGEELTLLVSNKEDQINDLDLKFAEKERQMTLDLDLKMKANAESTVNDFLSKVGKTSIAVSELNSLRKELETIKVNYAKEVTAEVGKAEGIAKARFEQDKRLLESEYKGSQATNIAKITALEEKVVFLTSQSAQWEKQLNAERTASVDRAKAGAVGTINVGDGSMRK